MSEMKTKPLNQKDVMQVGQVIMVTIKRLGINGEGVGYYKKKIVFIDGALPGEVAVAEVKKVEKNLAYAELVRVKEKSPHRIKPMCPVYHECGGCQLQHMNYEGQLQSKKELVVEAFSRYMKTDKPLVIHETLGMDHPWSYRNKAQLQVGLANGKVITGLFAAGTHQLIDISDCPIQHPITNQIVQTTRDVLEQLGIPIYNERKRTGVIRTVVARVGFQTENAQLTLVTVSDEIPKVKELILELRHRMPFVQSIMQNINDKKTSLIFGDRTKVLWGEATIDEKLGEVQFSLSPRAFFQLNPEQTIKLYSSVRKAAGLTGKELVVDAYCGVGTIGLWLAPDAGEVRGIEVIQEAVEDARHNAKQSGISNASFYVGKAEQLLPQWVKQGLKPNVVVVDPPRTGCDEQLLRALLSVKPKRIVYVSCNPSTLAKDCSLLAQGYDIKWVQPVDMFPQTAHVESVTLLEKR
ncbi:23S rRNA (uracil(1939)-C(5))-methyltransferase RlmD [Ammoniphilus sp. CFH 90114]|uniref:23S rRNA (uracil(1939)-C(5))-methyltransferase RlmD n=1 Tax=Ammoniphilus sp. CFH 90114 TaxID=2493665 RepID=UPI00100F6F01|nr:23S rRNA (uracil(1939)-C(5))-methyltransferase RlmD [Ammoniphilus sp. CFH 90114]RXT04964.1 23S rRNA (uracil(1939)-C(5))-methyltransferase RlmD [Ammoniphilus sp. CFH 90114]